MKKLSVIFLILVCFSFPILISAAEKEDITIQGIRTENDPVTSSLGGQATQINKSIVKIESNQYIDIRLTLKSNDGGDIPKTGDKSNVILFAFILLASSAGILVITKKRGKKSALSLFLAVTLMSALVSTATVTHAESEKPSYIVTENFSDETLKGFTFDKIISDSASAADTIKDSSGKVTGIKWVLDNAAAEQSVVYRLLLNGTIPDELINKEINISDAALDYTDSQGKHAAMEYPDVSVKWISDTFTLTYNINQPYHRDYTGVIETTEDETVNIGSGTVKAFASVFSQYTGECEFVEWNTKSDGSGTAYHAGDALPGQDDITLYAIFKSCMPEVYPLYEYDDSVGGYGVVGIGNVGSTITVIFPNGDSVSTVVSAGNGMWEIYVPGSSRPLLAGAAVRVVQREPSNGKLPSDTVFVVVLP